MVELVGGGRDLSDVITTVQRIKLNDVIVVDSLRPAEGRDFGGEIVDVQRGLGGRWKNLDRRAVNGAIEIALFVYPPKATAPQSDADEPRDIARHERAFMLENDEWKFAAPNHGHIAAKHGALARNDFCDHRERRERYRTAVQFSGFAGDAEQAHNVAALYEPSILMKLRHAPHPRKSWMIDDADNLSPPITTRSHFPHARFRGSIRRKFASKKCRADLVPLAGDTRGGAVICFAPRLDPGFACSPPSRPFRCILNYRLRRRRCDAIRSMGHRCIPCALMVLTVLVGSPFLKPGRACYAPGLFF